jgi:hypothetical protein
MLGQDLVKLGIGKSENAQVHLIHKKLLSSKSAFFDAAINGGFREASQNEILLQEEDPLVVDFFLTWLYISSLPTLSDYLPVSVKRRETIDMTLELQALAYTRIRDIFGKDLAPMPEFIVGLCQLTAPSSQLRRYLSDICAYELLERPSESVEVWKTSIDTHEEFAADVSKGIVRQASLKEKGALKHPYDKREYAELREYGSLKVGLRAAGYQEDSSLAGDSKAHKLIQTINHNLSKAAVRCYLPDVSAEWPQNLPSKPAIRAAGLYYAPTKDKPDRVLCLHCEVELSGWPVGYKPFKAHRKEESDCPIVQAVESGLEPPLLPYF